ncbi:hypothetical protein [Rhizobium leguminosarum]|uniref:hypothetical protein n=1 Tax=Rhizobium leguminosarum TaxID=384 RepID=UPI0010381FE0|nr:hypothetical protein [Rhizobium leguminosarum]TBF85699.1 hypothetical protein ELG85_37200 [Rhizobium leguminosarum]
MGSCDHTARIRALNDALRRFPFPPNGDLFLTAGIVNLPVGDVAAILENMFASRAADREKEYWAAIDQDSFTRDIRELKRLHAVLQRGPDGITLMRSRDEGLGGPDF